MLLKVLTTSFMICGLVLLVGLPFMLARRPVDGTQLELARYGTNMLLYFFVTCFSWLASAFCAMLIVRRARKDYAEQQKENMKGLIEGALRDHERKQ